MNHYCTLFDINYFTRGMALYESLVKHRSDFTLYVVAFDDACFDMLCALKQKRLVTIKLSELEKADRELFKVKEERTRREYCWTSTPAVVKYCMERFELDYCTYLDADIFFFADPEILLQELVQKGGDVLITEHRYTRCYDQAKKSGVYCVQFITFKNNFNGRKILQWWRKACLDWCHEFYEDGKFGDQKYLDDWKERFENVVVLEHLGGGVAPWNVQQYAISLKDDRVFVGHDSSLLPLVFYHFHELRVYRDSGPFYGRYYLDEVVKEIIYRPYLKKLNHLVPESLKPYYADNKLFCIEWLMKVKVVVKYFLARWVLWQV